MPVRAAGAGCARRTGGGVVAGRAGVAGAGAPGAGGAGVGACPAKAGAANSVKLSKSTFRITALSLIFYSDTHFSPNCERRIHAEQ